MFVVGGTPRRPHCSHPQSRSGAGPGGEKIAATWQITEDAPFLSRTFFFQVPATHHLQFDLLDRLTSGLVGWVGLCAGRGHLPRRQDRPVSGGCGSAGILFNGASWNCNRFGGVGCSVACRLAWPQDYFGRFLCCHVCLHPARVWTRVLHADPCGWVVYGLRLF